MNRIRALARPVPGIALVIAVAFALTGCPPGRPGTKRDPGAGTDGVRCGSGTAATAVYIDIRYDASGRPSADPENCEVSKNAKVTWRGPAGDGEAFHIRFKTTSPVAGDGRDVFVAEKGVGRYKVTQQMGANPGTYPYGIRANGQERDPAIIIR